MHHLQSLRPFFIHITDCSHVIYWLRPLITWPLDVQVAALMKTPAAADEERAAKAALFSRFTQLLPGALAADADPAGSKDRVHPAYSPAGSPLCEPGAQAGNTNGACRRDHADAMGHISRSPDGLPGSDQGAREAPDRPLVSELLVVMRDVVAHDPAPHQSLFRRASGCTELCRKPVVIVQRPCQWNSHGSARR